MAIASFPPERKRLKADCCPLVSDMYMEMCIL